MISPAANRSLVYALYLNAALLFAILAVLVSRGNGSLVPGALAAPAPGTMAGGNGLYVMPAQILNNIYGCYVLDTEKQTLCSYAYYGNAAGKPELRLIASRSIVWDRDLANFSTTPDPDSIKKLVQIGQQPLRGVNPQQAPAPNATGPANPEKVEPKADTQPQTPNKEPAQ